jgi:maltooligosyltrehalose synthase
MNARPSMPRVTYRLQLNRDFTFVQATAMVPYATLGVIAISRRS